MSRPGRPALIKSFFQELGDTITKADTQEQIALNTRACELILADHIKHFDQFYKKQGPGVMCINLANKGLAAYYLTIDDCHADLQIAKGFGHNDIRQMLESLVKAIETNNFNEQVLVMLIDNSQSSLLPIPRDHPAEGIQELQEELTV